MIFSRIDFIKASNIVAGTVEYTTAQIYNASISPEEVGTSFNIFASKPRTFKFTLDLGDSFFNDFTKAANTIGEYSLYFIRVYDENSTHVYSGLIKRSDYSSDEEQQKISISAKDFSILLSDLKSLSLAATDIITNSLDDMLTAYEYYIDQAAINYFNSSTHLLRDFSNIIAALRLDTLVYQTKNIKLIDIINIFTLANVHLFRADLETIYVEDAEYNNFTLPDLVVPVSDVIEFSQSSLVAKRINPSLVTNNLDDTGTYQQDILNIIELSYNRFVLSIDTKVTCDISSILNSYTLSMNQIIEIDGNKYVVKSINKKSNVDKVILWNSKNPPALGKVIHIGTSPFRTWTNPPTDGNILHLGSGERNEDTTGNIIHISADKRNDNTSDIVHAGSDERNDNTSDVIQGGTNERNEDTSDVIQKGSSERNDNTSDVLHISDD